MTMAGRLKDRIESPQRKIQMNESYKHHPVLVKRETSVVLEILLIHLSNKIFFFVTVHKKQN